jgi:hypothetical protein
MAGAANPLTGATAAAIHPGCDSLRGAAQESAKKRQRIVKFVKAAFADL